MLQIKKITKVYETDGFKQKALDSVSINFRDNEFASILGPSGSGKTTLLNIIGGLDQYTKGDLVINGISTKKYKDSDWDTYRNHRIGFVFQSYNLISHQTVLSNVELALTLSGVDKKERRRRAIEVLKKVGLKDHINKKPNQLSGGQMQRVAIARALINDPDILLADEPTGALDTETSKQIMQLLKEIADDKLVIMVTHNPDLAEEYSTRIVKIQDGHILDDTNPFEVTEEVVEDAGKKKKKSKKTSMSFLTALSLSLNNLMTKKGRTILTSFAGSIGIIGIALILSLSSGVQNYINRVQEDTLSSYPLSIEEASLDYSSMMQSMYNQSNDTTHPMDKVYSNNIMTGMLDMMGSGIKTNDLGDFKKYIEENPDKFNPYMNDIKYSYNLSLNLYKENGDSFVQVSPVSIFEKLGFQEDMAQMSFSNEPDAVVWNELTDNEALLKSQYDVLAGHIPTKYNEVVLILDENNEISDYALYAIGLKDQTEISKMLYAAMQGEEFETEETNYTYDEILNTSFRLVKPADYYTKVNGKWVSRETDPSYMKSLMDSAEEIKIVGIMKAKEDANIGHTTGSMGYHSSLTKYLIDANNVGVVKEQKDNPTIDVFTGLPFTIENSYEKNAALLGIVDIDRPAKIGIYPKDFESKSKIEEAIQSYNEGKEESEKITYTDYVGLLMSSVTTIVDIISYVLIAFVSISLVVSSIMIGIITYISVLERTKEIGILRAIGASKKDISRVFNAETFIIGLLAGVLGIVVTVLLNIPINMIIQNLTGISSITSLPIVGAAILVIISMSLTLIAGLIPSRMASRKNPVEALRTE